MCSPGLFALKASLEKHVERTSQYFKSNRKKICTSFDSFSATASLLARDQIIYKKTGKI